MTIAVPDNYGKIIPNNLYTNDLVDDVADISKDQDEGKADCYLLSTITFRRCD